MNIAHACGCQNKADVSIYYQCKVSEQLKYKVTEQMEFHMFLNLIMVQGHHLNMLIYGKEIGQRINMTFSNPRRCSYSKAK